LIGDPCGENHGTTKLMWYGLEKYTELTILRPFFITLITQLQTIDCNNFSSETHIMNQCYIGARDKIYEDFGGLISPQTHYTIEHREISRVMRVLASKGEYLLTRICKNTRSTPARFLPVEALSAWNLNETNRVCLYLHGRQCSSEFLRRKR